jgi:anthranilate phosphoribosyltransferase
MRTGESILRDLLDGVDLAPADAEALMGDVMDGRLGDVRLAAALAALRIKGVTAGELAGFARTMRARMVPVTASCGDRAVDTCGTGGDGQGTFNISTAAALVAAAAGAPVAKHGNRAASSACGSADVLEELGVALELGPLALARLLDEVGIAFLFAPGHHPAMRHAGPVRRELGVRTAFNLLGPLTNPAGVRRQLLGVYAPHLTDLMAAALRDLGAERALVVHGRDGQDELSLTGETQVTELRDGRLERRMIAPESVGLARCTTSDLAGGDAATNARLLAGVLDGEPDARADAVVLNAAGALVAAGVVDDLAMGVAAARQAIGTGRATRLLQRLREASCDLAATSDEATGGAA